MNTQTEVVQLCREMVAIPSVNPQDRTSFSEPYGEGQLAEFVCGWFRRHGLDAERQPVAPGRDPGRCHAALRRYLAERTQDSITVDLITEYPPMRCRAEHPLVRALVAAAAGVTGQEATGAVAYATDAGAFVHLPVPTPVLGPGQIRLAHSSREYVETEQLEQAQTVYRRYLEGRWGL